MRRSIALAAGALALGAVLAHAADDRRYAVLSLVGDKLMVVERAPSVGSNIDQNRRMEVDLPDASIDRAVTLAVDDALRKANPGAAPVLLAARDPRLFEASGGADRSQALARILATVKPTLDKARATHLVLVTKHRHRAMIRLRDGHVGTGTLEGLGFYVDHGTYTPAHDPSEAQRGFISPFTYFRVALVELASGRVVAEEHVIGSKATAPLLGNIGNAWKALGDQEKVEQLTAVIREETGRVVPRVVAQR